MSTQIRSQSEISSFIQTQADKFEQIKNKDYVTDTLIGFEENGLPNPFDVVREFIMEKGLKLYGGQALHEHLKKLGKPIYDKYEFPDYDVFSPDAWNHATELCDRFYKLGFYFVEAKASIVNDEKHQTYKVSVDLIYVLDLTQIGCSAQKLEIGDCSDCGMSLSKKCFSVFNNIPAIDILYDDKTEYSESYDYKTKISLVPDKLLVASPNWLKISMYLEMSQPFNDPSRLEKVFNRLQLFEREFKFKYNENISNNVNNPFKIKKKILSFYNNKTINTIHEFIKEYIAQNQLLHYGSLAYNFYIKGFNNHKEPELYHEVYTDEDPDRYYLDCLEKLKTKFSKKAIFKLVPRIMYWKDIDSDNYDIMVRLSNTHFYPLIRFTKSYECLPYVQFNKIRYASFDRIKYNYYRGTSLPIIIELSEHIPRNYQYLLHNLLNMEEYMKKKKQTVILGGKLQPFRKECIGGDVNKLMGNLYTNFGRNIKLSKKTKLYIDTPKKGLITKVYPAEKDAVSIRYRPAETKTKYYNTLLKFQKKHTMKSVKNKRKGIGLFKNNRSKQHIPKINTNSRIVNNKKIKKKKRLNKFITDKEKDIAIINSIM